MEGKRIRVLLADDHAAMRRGLVSLFGQFPDFEIVGQAIDGREAVRLAKELLPDVVIMDVRMPEMNGIDATRIIHSELPQVQVLGLAFSESFEDEMRKAGAADYLHKMVPSDVLVETVRSCGSAGSKRT